MDGPSLDELLDEASPPEYVCIQAFIDPAREAELEPLKDRAAQTGCAVTPGLGPRYLHSTGQLHKGGPARGVFVQLVASHPDDLLIPGAHETFGMLIDAQSLGDAQSLDARGLPVVRIQLGDDADAGLDTLIAALET